MILSDEDIKRAVKSGELTIDGFDELNVEPASYDMTVGPEGFSTSSRRIVNVSDAGMLILRAGDFGLAVTHEILKLPNNYVGRFGLRSEYSRKGLFASVGPQIDPGYHGRIILGLINLSPSDIVLGYREKLCSVEFHKLSNPAAKPYSGPYQDRLKLGSADIEPLVGTEGMAFSEVLTTLRGLGSTVSQLTKDVSTLKWSIPTIVGAGLALVAILVAIK